jgi:hypothetical protein
MDILEIVHGKTKAPSVVAAAPEIRISAGMLGGAARPSFLHLDQPPAADMTLWDRLRLSWQEPALIRDLIGG